MSNVIVEIEMGIVDPHGVIEDRNLMESLAVSRDEMKNALRRALD